MSDDADTPVDDKPTDDAPVNEHARVVRALADAMLRMSVLPVAITVVVAAIAGYFAAGVPGVAGAVTAGMVASGASLFTLWLMHRTAGMASMFVLGASMGGFLIKMFALLVTMMALRGVEAVDAMTLALTFIAMVLVWATSEAVAFRRTKVPTIVPGR
ncbi:hypothetical protein [Saccharopolyspora gloriosae]|uniref:hypothetical protein n=1 Tax=Saccharopolyspora gloriosae TaxID=455344 RepID=UPI001FB84CB3|nr:hypothetical protein [Saccharopolyspora gloriosae]